MGPLARLPVFYALGGKRAVVVGGSAAAAWKAELLAAAGAKVDVFSSDVTDEMLALTEDPLTGAVIILHRREWQTADLAGATLAVGSFVDDHEAAQFAATARTAGVPVNVIDKPAFCDFSFGAIVNRSPLVIGISTDGAAPVFGQAVRAKLEALIPRGFAQWAEAARQWRSVVQNSGLSFAARRKFWQIFTGRAVREPDRAPAQADLGEMMKITRAASEAVEHGSVTLVGAGPGDPELLTLRAVRALQAADAILFDDLVAPEVLDFARREARKLLVGKRGHGPACKQSEINTLMISLARTGRRVVRLKGGDPLIFGRAAEEIAACRRAGIPVEVIPGISAAQGAAARVAFPLTARSVARRVQFITGHGKDGRLPQDIDWASLADPATSTIIYMPARTIAELICRGLARGVDPATPAVVVARATRPDEAVIHATFADLPRRLAQASLPSPMLVLIGRAFAKRAETMQAESGCGSNIGTCETAAGANRDLAGFVAPSAEQGAETGVAG
jgi:uroporphyrin-III C-methyltransferase/precorrin-2 dehydrogenase/sirohydrochlorin ferrochelatase